ncbi:MAG: tetratricopeptide repeat protein [Caldiserica bacterium]|jgi:tetratricopeptide (TPR) repeat protein|nr:tetratricopeptide repeat protein [Caldisericota bacterium]
MEEEELLRKGVNLYMMGRYKEAEKLLRLSMRTDPDSSGSLICLDYLVRTLIAQGKLGMAERAARKLAREGGPVIETRWTLGEVLYKRGKYEEAYKVFEEVINEDPDFGQGGILDRINFHLALRKEGKKFKPNPENQMEAYFLYLQYQGYIYLKIYREAEFAIRQALELDPDNPTYHYELANFLKIRPRFCPNCGEPVHPGWRKCTVCGFSLSYPEPKVFQICPFCGAIVDTLWNSCPYCGRDPSQRTLWNDQEDWDF